VKKLWSIAALVTTLHFIEDAALVALGRYTEINFFIVLIGTVSFGILLAIIARHPKVKKWLAK